MTYLTWGSAPSASAPALANIKYQHYSGKDATIIMLSFHVLTDAEVYQNNGYGFQFHQSIPHNLGCYDFAITEDTTYLYFN